MPKFYLSITSGRLLELREYSQNVKQPMAQVVDQALGLLFNQHNSVPILVSGCIASGTMFVIRG